MSNKNENDLKKRTSSPNDHISWASREVLSFTLGTQTKVLSPASLSIAPLTDGNSIFMLID